MVSSGSANPSVSVVVITYNGARFIEAQLRSIAEQTYGNLEILVSDDNSTDDTLQIIRAMKLDRKIELLKNPGDRGINNNISFVFSQCKGDFIAIADQDDIWHPDKIQTLMTHIGDAQAIFSDSALIDEIGKSLDTSFVNDYLKNAQPEIGRNVIRTIHKNAVSGHALLIRKELLDIALPFSRELIYDQQLAIAATMSGGIRFLNEALVLHRQHSHNSINRLNLAKNAGPGNGDSGRNKRRNRRFEHLCATIDYVVSVDARMKASYSQLQDPRIASLRWLRTEFSKTTVQAFCARFYLLATLQRDLFYRYPFKRRMRMMFQLACRR